MKDDIKIEDVLDLCAGVMLNWLDSLKDERAGCMSVTGLLAVIVEVDEDESAAQGDVDAVLRLLELAEECGGWAHLSGLIFDWLDGYAASGDADDAWNDEQTSLTLFDLLRAFVGGREFDVPELLARRVMAYAVKS